ncbi:MAG: hypothetical protein ACRC1U_04445, partial [Vibrionaceae bacterium]
MDNSTDWLAKAFYQAADSFDTEKQTIELEVEAKSSEELQKLDQELAELARKIAQKDGQIDADMQALVAQLAQAAKKVIDIHDPNLPPAERKRLVREIRKKNAQAGSRMEFIQQQNKYRFEHLYEFTDGPIQTIPEPDFAQSSKVTSSDFAAYRLPAPTEDELTTLPQPETNLKTGQSGPLSRAPSFFEVLGQNAAHWQQKNQQHQTDKPLAAASLRPLSELEKQTGGYGAPAPFATQNQARQTVLQIKLPLHEASKEVTRDSHGAGAQQQSNTRAPSAVINALRQEEPRAREHRPAINQPIKLADHKLRAIEEEMAEAIDFFQSLASASQQEAESKGASEDNAASGDAIKNAKTQSARAADHKAASQETAQQDEAQAE